MATIYDRNGMRLSDVTVRSDPATGVMDVTPSGQAGALLLYYFGRGGREVVLDTGTAYLRGHLETRWESEGRRWLLRDAQPLAATRSETLHAASA